MWEPAERRARKRREGAWSRCGGRAGPRPAFGAPRQRWVAQTPKVGGWTDVRRSWSAYGRRDGSTTDRRPVMRLAAARFGRCWGRLGCGGGREGLLVASVAARASAWGVRVGL